MVDEQSKKEELETIPPIFFYNTPKGIKRLAYDAEYMLQEINSIILLAMSKPNTETNVSVLLLDFRDNLVATIDGVTQQTKENV